MHSIFIIGLVIITSFFYSKSIAFAGPDSGQQSMVADNQNPMQKGKGLLVTGILTTTILCSAGALSAMIWGMGGGLDYLAAGAAMITVGTGTGIPMMVIGGRRHRKWKQWNRADSAREEAFKELSITAANWYIGIQEERLQNAEIVPEKKRIVLPVLASEF